MKRLLSFLLILALAAACWSCNSPQHPEPVNDPYPAATANPDPSATSDPAAEHDAEQVSGSGFTPDPEKWYVAYIYVQALTADGFIGSGSFRKDVFVCLPGADTRYQICNTVRIVFKGEDYVAEHRVTDYVFPVNNETEQWPTEYTVKRVESARLADYKAGEPVYDKPVIYLYPEEDTVANVSLEFDGEITCSYPAYGGNGWQNFTASPDGTLTFPDGNRYYALYWEGRGGDSFDMTEGFCVKGCDTAEFLADVLPRLGLSFREANEFIIYWLPVLEANAYNLISFPVEEYSEAVKLTVEPEPDTVIRVYMVYKPLEEPVEIAPQEIVTPAREGFTVVEWGGGISG